MKIRVDQFEGPLDLLLQLIEEQQMDITAMSLANITEQFLNYVRSLQEKDPTNLASYLVIAAKLLVIKSKALLPSLDLGIEEEEAAFDLTQQLLLYKKFKEIGKYLKKMDLKRKQSWTREADFADRVTFYPDPDVNVTALHNSLKKVADELKEIIRHPKQVLEEVISISEKIEQVQKLISEKIETNLSTLLKDAKNKTEVIVIFLALLELIKQKVLVVDQDAMFSDITIKKFDGNK